MKYSSKIFLISTGVILSAVGIIFINELCILAIIPKIVALLGLMVSIVVGTIVLTRSAVYEKVRLAYEDYERQKARLKIEAEQEEEFQQFLEREKRK